MDIISEILETDRLAEEKLEQALRRRSEMLAECERKADKIHRDAVAEAELYRGFVLAERPADAANAFKELEREQLDALVEAYERCHEDWEQEIIAAITG